MRLTVVSLPMAVRTVRVVFRVSVVAMSTVCAVIMRAMGNDICRLMRVGDGLLL